MSNELYFIPIIAGAWRQPNREVGLLAAFEHIVDQGRKDSFRFGYGQFLRFMACSMEQWTTDSFGAPDELPRQAFDALHPCELLLERDGKRMGAWTLAQFPIRAAVACVHPGRYRLTLDTGWVLWEEALRPTDLLFTRAFPHHELPLAAQTNEVIFPVTREFFVMDAALTIRVRPGLESGVLEILLTSMEDIP